jgi:hypothetical protein
MPEVDGNIYFCKVIADQPEKWRRRQVQKDCTPYR